MPDNTVTITGIGELITSLPGMLSYVPDNHLVLVVVHDPVDGSTTRVGPVVCIDIDDDLKQSTAEAMSLIVTSARTYNQTITEVTPIVITDDVHSRVRAADFVDDYLVALPILPMADPAYVHALTPDAVITQSGTVTGHVGDWSSTALAAQTAYEGHRIRQSQSRWLAEGGKAERADQMREYHERRTAEQRNAD